MTGYKDSFQCLVQKDSAYKVNLGDDYEYPIKGMGKSFYKLDSWKYMKMKEVLYVAGLNKNILSISSLDNKGFIISFVDGELVIC